MSAVEVPELLVALAAQTDVGAALVDEHLTYTYVNAVLGRIHGREPDEMIGRPVEEMIPGVFPQVREYLESCLRDKTAVHNVTIEGEVGDRPGAWLVSYHPLELEGRPAVGLVATDISGQREAEIMAARRARQQAAIAEISRAGLVLGDPATFLDDVATVIAEVLEAELSVVLEERADGLCLRAGHGWRPGVVGHTTLPLHAHRDVPLAESVGLGEGAPLPEVYRRHDVEDGLTVPVGPPGALWGFLGVLTRAPREFRPGEDAFLRSIANIVHTSLERKLAHDQLELVAAQRARLITDALDAVDAERERMSAVLHDDVLQALLVARQDLARARDGDRTALDMVGLALDEGVTALRSAVSSIHPVVLAHAGLEAGLRSVAQEEARRWGFDVELRVSRPPAAAPARLVLSLAREALSNVGKHAQCRRAVVAIGRDNGDLVLEISDDGRGIRSGDEAAALEGGHVGLASCRHRVAALGGSSLVEGRPDGGTTVRFRLPVAEA